MKAVAVAKYGAIENLVATEIAKPDEAKGHDLLVRVAATSVNPVDTKVRNGTYDDYPDYYKRTPALPHVLGFDAAGVVESVGDEAQEFQPGDQVFYSGSPIRQGANAEYMLVDSRSVAKKPKSLNFTQAAAMPLTWITAYEALVERLEIREGEASGILIVNGSGGVGLVASQIARQLLRLPVVVTTTSREETTTWSKKMGATHTVNHRGDIVQQIRDLKLETPIKYVFITHTPAAKYIADSAAICAPFGRVCNIVQDEEIPMHGTEWMAKSLTYVWCLLGTKPYYGVQLASHGKILKELAELLDAGKIKCHRTQTLPLTADGLRTAHAQIENGGVMGKIALAVDAEGVDPREAFT